MIRGVIQYVRSPEVTLKEFKTGVALANSQAVEEWREKFVPIHFTQAGFKKYSYQARKGQFEPPYILKKTGRLANKYVPNPKYFWAKYRRFGTKDPLVKTGASEQAATHGAFKITSSANRATGVFQGLDRYFYQFRKDQGAPDKADELVRITQDEIDDLVKIHQITVERHLESITTRSETAAA